MFFGKGKRKLIANYKAKDFYKFYQQKNKSNAVDYKTFWEIWKDFIELRMQLVIYNNLEFYIPRRFGSLAVNIVGDAIRLKSNGEVKTMPDWGATMKLRKEKYPNKTPEEIKGIKDKPIVYYTNKNVDGKVVKFIWDKSTCNFKYHTHYQFKPTRKWQRKLAEFVNITKKLPYYERVRYTFTG